MPFSAADPQRACRVVPLKRDRCVIAFFVAIAVPFILVEREAAVSAGVDAHFNRPFWMLIGIFTLRPERHNGSAADVKRNPIKWSLRHNLLPSLKFLAGPEVVPCGGGRKEN